MSAAENVFAYPAPVWRRFTTLSHAGILSGADVLKARTGSLASKAVLELSVEPGPPLRTRFRGYGCPFTLAVGQWLAETLEQDGLAALGRIDAQAIRQTLEIPEDRAHCALMGEDLIRAIQSSLQPR